ncbi:hypothetical protein KWH35_23320, partial [Escherichia coli]|nr:hypothetical protein [Escherichia coli]
LAEHLRRKPLFGFWQFQQIGGVVQDHMPFQQPAVKDFYRAYPARLTADRQRVSVGFAVAMQVAPLAFKPRLA